MNLCTPMIAIAASAFCVVLAIVLHFDTARKVKIMKRVASEFDEFYNKVNYAKLREELLLAKVVQKLGLDPVKVGAIVDELREEVKQEIAAR